MTDPPDLRDLLDEDVSPEELQRLRRADEALRAVPAPPAEVPPSLANQIGSIAATTPLRRRRRRTFIGAVAAAIAVAAVAFAVGFWIAQDDFNERATVTMQPTEAGADARGLIRLGHKDEQSGNWEFIVEVEGLPQLPEDGYYVMWLSRDGEVGAICGTFSVGEGTTSVHMNASYRLADFEEWVVTAWLPNHDNADAPWLLHAPTT